LTIYIRHMDGPPSRDRLAVLEPTSSGEEIPCGDPSVTDAERAAAGRETLAGRWQAVLPGNRSRAAAQYSTDVSPHARKRGPAHAQKFHSLCTFG
jgi:hypothetical protein